MMDLVEARTNGFKLIPRLPHANELQLVHQQLMTEAPSAGLMWSGSELIWLRRILLRQSSAKLAAKGAAQFPAVEIVVSRYAHLDYGLCDRAEFLPFNPVRCHAFATVDSFESDTQQ